MVTPRDSDLDVVSGLTEQMDGALLRETVTWRRITAETSMFWHQRVSAVAHSACRNTNESRILKGDISSVDLAPVLLVNFAFLRIKIAFPIKPSSFLFLLQLCSTASHAFVFFWL